MNKPELLDLTRSERQALDDVFAKLTEDELCAPVLDGGRSMKDALAHITTWEQRVITAIAIGRTGETPPWPEPGFNPWDTDKLNERDFRANRERPLDDVVAEARRTFDEYVALIESFSDDEIAGELWYTPGIPLVAILRGHGDEHYRHHLDAMEAWWAGQGA
jgi:hypothetical protein